MNKRNYMYYMYVLDSGLWSKAYRKAVLIKNDRSRMFTALAIEQWPRHVYLPKIYHVPGGSLQLNPKFEISVITTISQQGSLPDDTL